MAASYTLHTPAGSSLAFPALIAAEYNGISVTIAEDFDAAKVASMSPSGKAPVLETPSGQTLFSSHAIARFLAGVRRDTGLQGVSLVDSAAVDGWMDFCAQELDLPSCVWTYPVLGYMPFNQASYEKAKADLAKGLATLDAHLDGKAYLVGDQITLADICAVSTLLYPMKLVADKDYLQPYSNVVRWFSSCVDEPSVQAVVGQVTLAKKEMKIAPAVVATGQD